MILGALMLLAGVWGMLLLAYRQPLRARWREPVLKQPVLTLEGDDWGAGPLAQAAALERLRLLLLRHRDGSGQPAIMTLGVVLEVADTQAMARHPGTYIGMDLRAPEYAPLRAVMEAGRQDGVFALQLHGQCHYWPKSLMAAAGHPEVAAWLHGPPHPRTEDLPSPLQSRWADASWLPSREIPAAEVAQAIAQEARLYRDLFGQAPRVAVPMTFVWNDAVEAAWARVGVRCVVTPGRRYTRREADGAPGGVDKVISNGQRAQGGMVYVVRDCYFEPALGHAVGDLAAAVLRKWRERRPCLVEMHRFNFLDEAVLESRLELLDHALSEVPTLLPNLRFLTTEALADVIVRRDAVWVDQAFTARLRAWLVRIRELPRFRKLCLLTGLALPFALLERTL